jgi:hypothetical protein
MHRRRDKNDLKYKADFEKVQSFVNEFDPCGFIHFGAPIDEYDCLTNQLLGAAYNGKTRTQIKDLILHEIEFHFREPDLEILIEPNKTKFYDDVEVLLNKLENLRKPSH